MLERRSTAEPARSAAELTIRDPARGDVVGSVPDMSAEDVSALVAAARQAQSGWAQAGIAARARLMLKLRGWIVAERSRVIDLMMRENGKTREDVVAELFYVLGALSFWARKAERFLRDKRINPGILLGRRVTRRFEPRGVIGVIAPWNGPLALGVGDAIPALIAGNTVVIKPSELTPLSTLLLVEEGMREVGFPPHVCSVATGGGQAGAALVDHVDMVQFTGSVATGRRIMMRAAERAIPVSAEMGGKDPMIVLRDADLDRAAGMAAYWGMCNAGQICISVERVYVEEPVYEEFLEKVLREVGALRQGPPGRPGSVDVGAITAPQQLDVIEDHVRDAVERGARVLRGGRRLDGPGRFYEPTVLVDVTHEMKVMRDETFGPVLPIMRVKDPEEALRLANDSRYGLNASVFSRDLAKAEALARRVQSGGCCVNEVDTNYFVLGAPFGGWKESGLGGRHGPEGIQKFCRVRTLLTARLAGKREPYMFPATRLKSALTERALVALYGRRGRTRRGRALLRRRSGLGR